MNVYAIKKLGNYTRGLIRFWVLFNLIRIIQLNEYSIEIHWGATRVSHMCNKHLDARTHVAQMDEFARGERTRRSHHYITGISRVFLLLLSLSLSFVSRLYMAYVIIHHYAIGHRREIASIRGGTHRVKSWPIMPRIRAMVPVIRLV